MCKQSILINLIKMKTQKHEYTQLSDFQEIEFAGTLNLAGKTHTHDFIALRPCVENMGLNWSGQLQAIKRNPSLFELCAYVKASGADGKSYEMLCMLPGDFQNWLWSLNPKSENFKVELWEEYKKGLVLHILLMLKVSLDEVERLRHVEKNYKQLLERQREYLRIEVERESYKAEAREKAKQLRQQAAQHRELLSEAVFGDPNQMHLFLD